MTLNEDNFELQIVDSHTGGEPTRTIINGWPEPEGQTMQQKLEFVKSSQAKLKSSIIKEPKGHAHVVGALLTVPERSSSQMGVIFFNDVGYLGMCGHGLIGVVETLRHLGQIKSQSIQIDTPAGVVSATLEADGNIQIENVESYLYKDNISVSTRNHGDVVGDIGYGGNWFFMADTPGIDLSIKNIPELLSVSREIRHQLITMGITGKDGREIDHIEFYGNPLHEKAMSKNFVLCPGVAYDRSACGTGTSAKMAALHAHDKLALDEPWIQESITGSLYEGRLMQKEGRIIPTIKSKAHVYFQGKLLFHENDPFSWGIPGL